MDFLLMIYMSLNCTRLENPTKKITLKWLVESQKPVIILLQESMGEGNKICA